MNTCTGRARAWRQPFVGTALDLVESWLNCNYDAGFIDGILAAAVDPSMLDLKRSRGWYQVVGVPATKYSYKLGATVACKRMAIFDLIDGTEIHCKIPKVEETYPNWRIRDAAMKHLVAFLPVLRQRIADELGYEELTCTEDYLDAMRVADLGMMSALQQLLELHQVIESKKEKAA